MRRNDRAITDDSIIFACLDKCRIMRFAFTDDEGLFLVPVNFGYEKYNDTVRVYFHGAKDGRKAQAFETPRDVFAEAELDMGITEGPEACTYGNDYFSFMSCGVCSKLTDTEEKCHGLAVLMRHQTGKEFVITPEMAGAVNVYRADLTGYTAKQRRMRK